MNQEEEIIEILLSHDYSYLRFGDMGQLTGLRKTLHFKADEFANYLKTAAIRKYGHELIYILTEII
jgi:hypothetical protein